MIPILQDLRSLGLWFHELEWKQQIALLANTNKVLQETQEYTWPTNVNDLSEGAFLKVFRYIQDPHLRGIFAASVSYSRYEYHSGIIQQGLETDIVSDLLKAQEEGLWELYSGMVDYDPILMAQIVHCLCLIGGKVFPGEGNHPPMSPGSSWLSYQREFKSLSGSPKNCLVLGSLSPYSILDYKNFQERFLPDTEFSILDIEKGLNKLAAEHYGLIFIQADALKLSNLYSQGRWDLITTDGLTPFLVDYFPTAKDYQEAIRIAQATLWTQVFTVLSQGGSFICVEPYISDHIGWEEEIRQIENLAKFIGYKEVGVQQVETFPYRDLLEKFLRGDNVTPTINPGQFIIHLQK